MFTKISYSLVQIDSKRSIRDAMEVLNKIDERFLVVLNREKKLLGTITDGDIRRAMLKNIDIYKKVELCMNKNPIFAYEKSENYKNLFKKMNSIIKFLPILNKEKKIITILLEDTVSADKIALVMAGGYGSRLGKITQNTPKPLLKIGSKTMLEIILEKLETSGYDKIYISTHYLHNRIKKFLNNRNSSSKIKIIYEPKPLGTAGSISKIKNLNFDYLTVLNGDIVSDISLDALNEFHLEKKHDLTLTVAHFSTEIPFGVVDLDSKFQFKSLIEKPTKKYFILSGIYCLSKSICDLVTESYTDMPELINNAKRLGYKIGIFPIYEYWNDIGTSKALNNENKRSKI